MRNNSNSSNELFLRTLIEKLNTDVLFECFAGLVVRSSSLDVNDIHVIPKENHRRNYKNDIIQAPREDDFDPKHYFDKNDRGLLIMYTSRSSMLDYLPEDFYTEPDNTDEFLTETGEKKSKDEIENYREKVKEQLKSAHRFFKPLEVEYNKVRVKRELYELDQIENFDKTLETFWGSFKVTNGRWKRFFRTLHLVSFIIGDEKKTKALIEFVLETEVTLSFDIEEYCEMDDAQRKSLMGDERIMGFNVAVGNAVYDYLEVCTLRVEDLSTEEFFEYFDMESENRKLLDEIVKYYFPLNLEVRLDFSINPHKGIADENNSVAVPVLGYSSKLGV